MEPFSFFFHFYIVNFLRIYKVEIVTFNEHEENTYKLVIQSYRVMKFSKYILLPFPREKFIFNLKIDSFSHYYLVNLVN